MIPSVTKQSLGYPLGFHVLDRLYNMPQLIATFTFTIQDRAKNHLQPKTCGDFTKF